MKAGPGDLIRITRDASYGTVYGLVKVGVGETLCVKSRNDTDDGVITTKKVKLKSLIGERVLEVEVGDSGYEIILQDTEAESD